MHINVIVMVSLMGHSTNIILHVSVKKQQNYSYIISEWDRLSVQFSFSIAKINSFSILFVLKLNIENAIV